MNSQTEENYLKAIYKLSQDSDLPVPTSAIAAELNVQSATVTDMLKRLNTKNLIHYTRYKGVNLSASGKKQALSIVRKHRLWEVFLVEKLGFGWDEVHDLAEQLEHIDSTELVNRLDDYLGNPKSDPHGDFIPDKNGKLPQRKRTFLDQLQPGEEGTIAGVKEDQKSLLHYLDERKIKIGDKIIVARLLDFDQSVELSVNGKHIHISGKIAENLLVTRV